MTFNYGIIPILLMMVLSILIWNYYMRSISKEVSREKLNGIEDLSTLWKNKIPPSEVLTENGLRLLRHFRIGLVCIVVLGFIVGILFTGFSTSPIIAT